ncbi:MAG: cobalt transporter CbiM [bacterium]|nr:cobalt transporter CbiM [bacterium]
MARAGVLSASFFVASLIHVPFGPASIHLVLNGIVGLILGWAAFPVILAALTLQAVLFNYGGITTLGVNTVIMAGPAVICYHIFGRLVNSDNNTVSLAATFACGSLPILLGGIFIGLALIFTGEGFFHVAGTVMIAHLPVIVIEGMITVFCVSFFKKVQPAIMAN